MIKIKIYITKNTHIKFYTDYFLDIMEIFM
jgi:hypothetical protein